MKLDIDWVSLFIVIMTCLAYAVAVVFVTVDLAQGAVGDITEAPKESCELFCKLCLFKLLITDCKTLACSI